MNSHGELLELSAYLDGELEASARTALEAHLPSCAECSETLAGLRATLADLRALEPAEPTEQQIWAMRSVLATARRKESKRGARVMAAGGIAAGVIAIAAVVLTHQGSKSTTDNALNATAGSEAAAPLVMRNENNYTATNARDVFLLASVSTTMVQGTDSMADRGAIPASAQKAAPFRGAVPPAQESTPTDAMRTCEERIVRPSQKQPGRAVLYLFARYGGKNAYFLVYEVPADSPARRELWILEPNSCRVLRYEQQNI